MPVFFSPSTCGFYVPGVSCSVPEDAVELPADRHEALMEAQARGAHILADGQTGLPLAVFPEETAATRRRAVVAAIKREASRRIEAASPIWQQLNDQRVPSAAGAARFAAIDAIRSASDAIENLLAEVSDTDIAAFPVSENPLWPSFEELA